MEDTQMSDARDRFDAVEEIAAHALQLGVQLVRTKRLLRTARMHSPLHIERHTRVMRRLQVAATVAAAERAHAHRASVPGPEPTTTTIFPDSSSDDDTNTEDRCSICLCETTELTPCGHAVHDACLQQWATQPQQRLVRIHDAPTAAASRGVPLSCPVCRRDVRSVGA